MVWRRTGPIEGWALLLVLARAVEASEAAVVHPPKQLCWVHACHPTWRVIPTSFLGTVAPFLGPFVNLIRGGASWGIVNLTLGPLLVEGFIVERWGDGERG